VVVSLTAERIALANCAVEQAFARASVAWQAIPHWDTGDPGQTMVRDDTAVTLAAAGLAASPPVPPVSDDPFGAPRPLDLTQHTEPFRVTLAQATAQTPDALLAAVLPRAAQLAQKFDAAVLGALAGPAGAAATKAGGTFPWFPALAAPAATPPAPGGPVILAALILGRQLLEDSGYRASACLVASTKHFTDLNQWVGSNVATEGLLVGANANSLHRASTLDAAAKTATAPALPDRMLLIGRRQEIAHGRAATATPGEEPIDLAVSVPPSLEVVGETATGQIQLAVRVRYATRFKDERGVVVFHNP
jgi:hypothetical protein